MDPDREFQLLFEAAKAQELNVLIAASCDNNILKRKVSDGLAAKVLIRKPDQVALVGTSRAAGRVLKRLKHSKEGRACGTALLPHCPPERVANKYKLRFGDVTTAQRLLDERQVTFSQVLEQFCRSEPDAFLQLLNANLGELVGEMPVGTQSESTRKLGPPPQVFVQRANPQQLSTLLDILTTAISRASCSSTTTAPPTARSTTAAPQAPAEMDVDDPQPQEVVSEEEAACRVTRVLDVVEPVLFQLVKVDQARGLALLTASQPAQLWLLQRGLPQCLLKRKSYLAQLVRSGKLQPLLKAMLQPTAPPGIAPPAPWHHHLDCKALLELCQALRGQPAVLEQLLSQIVELLRQPAGWRWTGLVAGEAGTAPAAGLQGGVPHSSPPATAGQQPQPNSSSTAASWGAALALLPSPLLSSFPAAARQAYLNELLDGCVPAQLLLLPLGSFILVPDADKAACLARIQEGLGRQLLGWQELRHRGVLRLSSSGLATYVAQSSSCSRPGPAEMEGLLVGYLQQQLKQAASGLKQQGRYSYNKSGSGYCDSDSDYSHGGDGADGTAPLQTAAGATGEQLLLDLLPAWQDLEGDCAATWAAAAAPLICPSALLGQWYTPVFLRLRLAQRQQLLQDWYNSGQLEVVLGSKEAVLERLAGAGCYDEVKELVWPLANSSSADQRLQAWQLLITAAAASHSTRHVRGMMKVVCTRLKNEQQPVRVPLLELLVNSISASTIALDRLPEPYLARLLELGRYVVALPDTTGSEQQLVVRLATKFLAAAQVLQARQGGGAGAGGAAAGGSASAAATGQQQQQPAVGGGGGGDAADMDVDGDWEMAEAPPSGDMAADATSGATPPPAVGGAVNPAPSSSEWKVQYHQLTGCAAELLAEVLAAQRSLTHIHVGIEVSRTHSKQYAPSKVLWPQHSVPAPSAAASASEGAPAGGPLTAAAAAGAAAGEPGSRDSAVWLPAPLRCQLTEWGPEMWLLLLFALAEALEADVEAWQPKATEALPAKQEGKEESGATDDVRSSGRKKQRRAAADSDVLAFHRVRQQEQWQPASPAAAAAMTAGEGSAAAALQGLPRLFWDAGVLELLFSSTQHLELLKGVLTCCRVTTSGPAWYHPAADAAISSLLKTVAIELVDHAAASPQGNYLQHGLSCNLHSLLGQHWQGPSGSTDWGDVYNKGYDSSQPFLGLLNPLARCWLQAPLAQAAQQQGQGSSSLCAGGSSEGTAAAAAVAVGPAVSDRFEQLVRWLGAGSLAVAGPAGGVDAAAAGGAEPAASPADAHLLADPSVLLMYHLLAVLQPGLCQAAVSLRQALWKYLRSQVAVALQVLPARQAALLQQLAGLTHGQRARKRELWRDVDKLSSALNSALRRMSTVAVAYVAAQQVLEHRSNTAQGSNSSSASTAIAITFTSSTAAQEALGRFEQVLGLVPSEQLLQLWEGWGPGVVPEVLQLLQLSNPQLCSKKHKQQAGFGDHLPWSTFWQNVLGNACKSSDHQQGSSSTNSSRRDVVLQQLLSVPATRLQLQPTTVQKLQHLLAAAAAAAAPAAAGSPTAPLYTKGVTTFSGGGGFYSRACVQLVLALLLGTPGATGLAPLQELLRQVQQVWPAGDTSKATPEAAAAATVVLHDLVLAVQAQEQHVSQLLAALQQQQAKWQQQAPAGGAGTTAPTAAAQAAAAGVIQRAQQQLRDIELLRCSHAWVSALDAWSLAAFTARMADINQRNPDVCRVVLLPTWLQTIGQHCTLPAASASTAAAPPPPPAAVSAAAVRRTASSADAAPVATPAAKQRLQVLLQAVAAREDSLLQALPQQDAKTLENRRTVRTVTEGSAGALSGALSLRVLVESCQNVVQGFRPVEGHDSSIDAAWLGWKVVATYPPLQQRLLRQIPHLAAVLQQEALAPLTIQDRAYQTLAPTVDWKPVREAAAAAATLALQSTPQGLPEALAAGPGSPGASQAGAGDVLAAAAAAVPAIGPHVSHLRNSRELPLFGVKVLLEHGGPLVVQQTMAALAGSPLSQPLCVGVLLCSSWPAAFWDHLAAGPAAGLAPWVPSITCCMLYNMLSSTYGAPSWTWKMAAKLCMAKWPAGLQQAALWQLLTAANDPQLDGETRADAVSITRLFGVTQVAQLEPLLHDKEPRVVAAALARCCSLAEPLSALPLLLERLGDDEARVAAFGLRRSMVVNPDHVVSLLQPLLLQSVGAAPSAATAQQQQQQQVKEGGEEERQLHQPLLDEKDSTVMEVDTPQQGAAVAAGAGAGAAGAAAPPPMKVTSLKEVVRLLEEACSPQTEALLKHLFELATTQQLATTAAAAAKAGGGTVGGSSATAAAATPVQPAPKVPRLHRSLRLQLIGAATRRLWNHPSSNAAAAFLTSTAGITATEDMELPAALVWGPGNAPDLMQPTAWEPRSRTITIVKTTRGRKVKMQQDVGVVPAAWQLLPLEAQQAYATHVLLPLLGHPEVQIRGRALFALEQLAQVPLWEAWAAAAGGAAGDEVIAAAWAGKNSARLGKSNRAAAGGQVLSACCQQLAQAAAQLLLTEPRTTDEGKEMQRLALELLEDLVMNGPALQAAAASAGESGVAVMLRGQQLVLQQLQAVVTQLVTLAVTGLQRPAAAVGSSSGGGEAASNVRAALALDLLKKVGRSIGPAEFADVRLEAELRNTPAADARSLTAPPATPGNWKPTVKQLAQAVRVKQLLLRRAAAATMAAVEAALTAAATGAAGHQQQLPAVVVQEMGRLINWMALAAMDCSNRASIEQLLRQRILGQGLSAAASATWLPLDLHLLQIIVHEFQCWLGPSCLQLLYSAVVDTLTSALSAASGAPSDPAEQRTLVQAAVCEYLPRLSSWLPTTLPTTASSGAGTAELGPALAALRWLMELVGQQLGLGAGLVDDLAQVVRQAANSCRAAAKKADPGAAAASAGLLRDVHEMLDLVTSHVAGVQLSTSATDPASSAQQQLADAWQPLCYALVKEVLTQWHSWGDAGATSDMLLELGARCGLAAKQVAALLQDVLVSLQNTTADQRWQAAKAARSLPASALLPNPTSTTSSTSSSTSSRPATPNSALQLLDVLLQRAGCVTSGATTLPPAAASQPPAPAAAGGGAASPAELAAWLAYHLIDVGYKNLPEGDEREAWYASRLQLLSTCPAAQPKVGAAGPAAGSLAALAAAGVEGLGVAELCQDTTVAELAAQRLVDHLVPGSAAAAWVARGCPGPAGSGGGGGGGSGDAGGGPSLLQRWDPVADLVPILCPQ